MSENPIIMPPTPPPSPPTPPSNALAYVITCLGVALACMLSVVMVTLLRPPPADNMPIIVVIIGFGSATLAGIASFLKGEQTSKAVQDVHVIMNSRFTEWMEQTRMATSQAVTSAHAQGVLAGSKAAQSQPAPTPTPTPTGENVASPPPKS